MALGARCRTYICSIMASFLPASETFASCENTSLLHLITCERSASSRRRCRRRWPSVRTLGHQLGDRSVGIRAQANLIEDALPVNVARRFLESSASGAETDVITG